MKNCSEIESTDNWDIFIKVMKQKKCIAILNFQQSFPEKISKKTKNKKLDDLAETWSIFLPNALSKILKVWAKLDHFLPHTLHKLNNAGRDLKIDKKVINFSLGEPFVVKMMGPGGLQYEQL